MPLAAWAASLPDCHAFLNPSCRAMQAGRATLAWRRKGGRGEVWLAVVCILLLSILLPASQTDGLRRVLTAMKAPPDVERR